MNFIDRKWLSIAFESAFSGMRVGGKRTFNKKVVSGLSIFAALLPKFAQLSSRKIHIKAQKHSFRSYAIGLAHAKCRWRRARESSKMKGFNSIHSPSIHPSIHRDAMPNATRNANQSQLDETLLRVIKANDHSNPDLSVTRLLTEGANPDAKDLDGKSALMLAIEKKNQAAVEALAPVANLKDTNKLWEIPLVRAAELDNVGAARVLAPLSDHSATDLGGDTALTWAARNASFEMIELLLIKSNPNRRVEDGSRNALEILVSNNAASERTLAAFRLLADRTRLREENPKSMRLPMSTFLTECEWEFANALCEFLDVNDVKDALEDAYLEREEWMKMPRLMALIEADELGQTLVEQKKNAQAASGDETPEDAPAKPRKPLSL